MERKLVLASHGNFAAGILSSLEMICGKQREILTINAYMTTDQDLSLEVEQLLGDNKDSELVVITDIYGGSVNNEFIKYVTQPNFYLIAGMNLALLIDIVNQLEYAESLSELLDQAVLNSRNTIQFCNQTIHQTLEEEEF